MRLVVLLLVAPLCAGAQASDESRVRGEVRSDVIVARAMMLHAGLGAAYRLGYNVRLHVVAAGGPAWRSSRSGESLRGDATLRLLLDPFGETGIGLSVGGGLGVLHDAFEETRPVGLVVFAIEGQPRAPLVWSLEVGLGGGARVGVVLRRRARGYR